MYFTYFIVYFVTYSVYLPPMGRRRSVKKYCTPPNAAVAVFAFNRTIECDLLAIKVLKDCSAENVTA